MINEAASVAAAAAKLDETYPGWEAQIDLGTLDIASPVHCILGQIGQAIGISMGCYVNQDEVLQSDPLDYHRNTGYGLLVDDFLTSETLIAFSGKRAEPFWVALIKERFASGCLSG